MGMESYRLDSHGECAREAVIGGVNYRISILTPALVRVEYSEKGVFEDHATQTVLNRDFPVPEFWVEETEDEILVRTDALELHYDRKAFTGEGLWAKVYEAGDGEGVWHYGDKLEDLKGTAGHWMKRMG